MHGIIFCEFREYAERKHGVGAWNILLKQAGIADRVYLAKPYPDAEIVSLVVAASTITGKSVPALLEDFGEFLAPSLMNMYGNLMKPEWRTLDVIEHAEGVVHKVVRGQPGRAPPSLRARRMGPHKLVLTYDSPRKLCALAVGVGIGLGKYFQESVSVQQNMCMHEGADRCEIVYRIV